MNHSSELNKSDVSQVQIFNRPEPAVLVERPNRFVMMVRDSNGNLLRAHCPNPGKLTEFMIPGQSLLIERHAAEHRSTDCTAAAVLYKGKTIFLYSAKANDITKSIILPGLYPDFTVVPEWTAGNSRFDFLLHNNGNKLLVEVKSCSLVEHSLAMFPDTATQRGSRHIEELIQLAAQGYRGEILFVISHEDAQQFMPNPHTDPTFCKSLNCAASHLNIRAVSVKTSPEGFVQVVNPNVPIETEYPAKLSASCCGVYMLVMRVEESLEIPVASLHNPRLGPGWYIYIGSAKKHLRQRISRHLRKKKKTHWHIDYLTKAVSFIQAYPIATYADIECSLAHDIRRVSDGAVTGFGSSDCSCSSHLMYFQHNPLHHVKVVEHLFRYRHVVFRQAEHGPAPVQGG